MADKGPTRAELQQEINDRQAVINRQQRELENMRQELNRRMDAQRITEENSQQLYLDRERLTATVEILSRRIASDGIRMGTDQYSAKQATPVNQTPYRG